MKPSKAEKKKARRERTAWRLSMQTPDRVEFKRQQLYWSAFAEALGGAQHAPFSAEAKARKGAYARALSQIEHWSTFVLQRAV